MGCDELINDVIVMGFGVRHSWEPDMLHHIIWFVLRSTSFNITALTYLPFSIRIPPMHS